MVDLVRAKVTIANNRQLACDELLEMVGRIGGIKILIMDSCQSDIPVIPPRNVIYVAAADLDKTAQGDMTPGVICPTLLRYSVPEILATGAYLHWDGMIFEFGTMSHVRIGPLDSRFMPSGTMELPKCTHAQQFYEAMTGDGTLIAHAYSRRYMPRPDLTSYQTVMTLHI